jgi:outer membrane protein assembly factor BamB
VLCLDLKTGKPLWERTAYEGRPKEKRHIKSTYASPTPATDGRVLVAYFGSQGLYAYDLDGKPLWNLDLGLTISPFLVVRPHRLAVALPWFFSIGACNLWMCSRMVAR